MTKNISGLSKILNNIHRCLVKTDDGRIFLVDDSNYDDDDYQDVRMILKRIEKLQDRAIYIETNNFFTTEHINDEIKRNNKGAIMLKTLVSSISRNGNKFLSGDMKSGIIELINKSIDDINQLICQIEHTKSDSKDQEDQNYIQIGTVKFYSKGGKIIKFTIGEGIYDKKSVDSPKGLTELWDYSNKQEALAVLYAIAKKYSKNKMKEFSIDFYSTEFDKDFKYFKENSRTLTNYRETNKAIKETLPNKRYNGIVSRLRKFINEYKGGIEIIDDTFGKNEKFTSKKEKQYLIKISV